MAEQGGGFRVGGGVHNSYTFQGGLVGSFTSSGIGAIQVLRNAIFREIGPPPTPS